MKKEIKIPANASKSVAPIVLKALDQNRDRLNKAIALLEEVANDFEDTGCEDCGTISIKVINKVRKFVGYRKAK